MDENPGGTPNPLNPVANTPEPYVPTGDAETPVDPLVESLAGPEMAYEEVPETTYETTPTRAVTPEAVAKAVPEMSATPVSSTMPRMATAPIRPYRPGRPVIDPMMRPRANTPRVHSAAPEPVSDEFDELADEPITAPSAPVQDNLVAKNSIVRNHKDSKRSRKKVLIVSAVTLIMIAVICGIMAAVFFAFGGGTDRVSAAINRILDGNTSSIVNANGTITIETDSVDTDKNCVGILPCSPSIASVTIDLNSTVDFKSGMAKNSARILPEYTDGSSFELDVDEMTTQGGDTYFKVSNLANAVSENSSLASMTALAQLIDGQWISIPNTTSGDDFTDSLDSVNVLDNTSTCLTNVMMSLPTYGKDLVNKYRNNQFVKYSTNNLNIARKRDTLYRLEFDDEKLAAFINSLSNTGFANALGACVGNTATNNRISATDIAEIFEGYPTLYVEINKNNDFTRVYFEAEMGGGMTTATADLDLSYPSKLEITPPDNYLDLNTLVEQILTTVMDNITIEGETETETTEIIEVEEGEVDW